PHGAGTLGERSRMLEGLIARQRSRAVKTIHRLIPWHRLPTWLGLLNLVEVRETLRAQNLHDTNEIDPGHAGPTPAPFPVDASSSQASNSNGVSVDSRSLRSRSADGSYNDLESPRMGMAGTRFGRNVPLDDVRVPTPADLMAP